MTKSPILESNSARAENSSRKVRRQPIIAVTGDRFGFPGKTGERDNRDGIVGGREQVYFCCLPYKKKKVSVVSVSPLPLSRTEDLFVLSYV